MTWLKFNNIDNFNTFEKQYCYDGFIWSIQNRWDADGNAFDIIDNVKIPLNEITLASHDPNRTPLLYRKMGKLNKTGGYTTSIHAPRLSTDGFYYCVKMEDKTANEVRDEDNNIIRPSLLVPFESLFYNNCSWDGETEIEPDWPTEEE
tara:strand:+ start:13964 stop:14407 length:444 start_codon:yes stop_codon:yes gene_type:complete